MHILDTSYLLIEREKTDCTNVWEGIKEVYKEVSKQYSIQLKSSRRPLGTGQPKKAKPLGYYMYC